MRTTDTWKNKLYFGDNLDIMRKYIEDESVDLIYLDPPFNSKNRAPFESTDSRVQEEIDDGRGFGVHSGSRVFEGVFTHHAPDERLG